MGRSTPEKIIRWLFHAIFLIVGIVLIICFGAGSLFSGTVTSIIVRILTTTAKITKYFDKPVLALKWIIDKILYVLDKMIGWIPLGHHRHFRIPGLVFTAIDVLVDIIQGLIDYPSTCESLNSGDEMLHYVIRRVLSPTLCPTRQYFLASPVSSFLTTWMDNFVFDAELTGGNCAVPRHKEICILLWGPQTFFTILMLIVALLCTVMIASPAIGMLFSGVSTLSRYVAALLEYGVITQEALHPKHEPPPLPGKSWLVGAKDFAVDTAGKVREKIPSRENVGIELHSLSTRVTSAGSTVRNRFRRTQPDTQPIAATATTEF